MVKISTVLALAILASACSSSPPRQDAAAPAAAAAAASATTAPAAVQPAPAPTAVGTAATSQQPKRLMNGFTMVTKNGVATYCRQDVKTGSHIVVQQRCLSQREYDALEDDARRDMDRIRNTMSPNMGTTGGSAH